MDEGKKYFVSDVSYDLPTLRDYWAHTMTGWRKWCAWISPVVVLLYVAFNVTSSPEIVKWFCIGYLILLAVFILRERDGGKGYQKFLEESGGIPVRNLLYIRETGIRCRNPETEKDMQITYSEITSITRTKSLFILNLANGKTTLLNHRTLTGGTADELEQWLREQTGITKIPRPVDNRIFRKATIGVAAIGLVLALSLEANLFAPRPKNTTVSQATQVLAELGIRVPEVDEEMWEEVPPEYMVEELLYLAGMGEYDFDTFEWSPATSGVYTFDLEFFDVGNMYTDFLRGVEALSGGELEFTDVVEDDSHVDMDSGMGWKEVTFSFDGRTRTIRAELIYDWFDPSFANAIAELTEDNQTGKRLRFYFDGYQVAYVFWGDDAWAREFSRATGLRLTDRLE